MLSSAAKPKEPHLQNQNQHTLTKKSSARPHSKGSAILLLPVHPKCYPFSMEARTDLAIILRSVPFEDRHRIVTALTLNHGQISGLAKNSIQSRRFGGTLEPFAASDWDFVQKPGAELVQLTGATIRHSFEGLRDHFEKLAIASVFNEIMMKIAPQNENCKGLFQLHSNALSALNDLEISELKAVAFLNAYMTKALQWSGNQPRLLQCYQCEMRLEEVAANFEISCDVSSAGWTCPHCTPLKSTPSSLNLSAQALGDFLLFLSTPIRQVAHQIGASLRDHQALFQFIELLYIYHIPGFDKHPLKSLRFIGLKSNVQPLKANHR